MANPRILLFLPHLDVSGGLGVHARLLLEALQESETGDVQFHVAAPAEPLELMRTATLEPLDRSSFDSRFHFHTLLAPIGFDLAEPPDVLLKPALAAIAPGMIYCSYYLGLRHSPCSQIVTFHDAGFLENPAGFGAVAARRRASFEAARAAIDLIHCISQDARDRVCRNLDWPVDRTKVVWHALPDSDDVLQAAKAKPSTGRPYFFLPVGAATGFNRIRKNVPNAVRAFRLLNGQPQELIIAGTAPLTDTVLRELLPENESGTLQNEIWRSADGRIAIHPSLPRIEFLAAMRHATAVVYPSRYEGFGLPTIEAFAMDVPLIACRATSIPEIVGDAGVLIDPDDVTGMAAAMARLATDESLRTKLIEAGRRRLPFFTRRRLANEMMAMFAAFR